MVVQSKRVLQKRERISELLEELKHEVVYSTVNGRVLDEKDDKKLIYITECLLKKEMK